MDDTYSSVLCWPSISAMVFLQDSVCPPEVTYPMTRRKSRLWREGIMLKQRSRGGSRSTSALSTPPAEMDADLEQFLEGMDFSSFEDSQQRRDAVHGRRGPGAPDSDMEVSPVSPTSLELSSLEDMNELENRRTQGSKEAGHGFMVEGFTPASEGSRQSEESADEQTEKDVEVSYEDINAHNVCIAGSFSNWEKMRMKRHGNQWRITLCLLPGMHYYKLIKDNQWICDESKEVVRDEFGNRNNCLRVGSVSVKLRWTRSEVKKSAYVVGTFSNWRKMPMRRVGKFAEIHLSLPFGPQEYKFCVDDKWRVDDTKPTKTDDHGNVNNISTFGRQEYKLLWEGKRARQVCVAGNFNGWRQVPLRRISDRNWTLSLDLDYNTFDFKFIIDGQWTCDDRWPKRFDAGGNENNFFVHGIKM